MSTRLGWFLPALFVAIAAIQMMQGDVGVAALYLAVAGGMTFYGLGRRQRVAPMQWFGAGIAMFAVVILLWRLWG